MRAPGYLRQVGSGELAPDGRSVVVTFRLRLWHPGLWLDVARYWWQGRMARQKE